MPSIRRMLAPSATPKATMNSTAATTGGTIVWVQSRSTRSTSRSARAATPLRRAAARGPSSSPDHLEVDLLPSM
jgi:hypothetical protein